MSKVKSGVVFVSKYSDGRPRCSIVFDPAEKRTKDSFKDETDINNIMKKYLRTGQLPALVARDARYGDFSDVVSYQESLEVVARAQEAFYALPAAIRTECGNDPAVFLHKVQDRAWAERHALALPKATPVSEAEGAPSSQPVSSPKGDAGAPKSGKSDA